MDVRLIERIYARLEDLKKRAVRGDLGVSAFFSPSELYLAREYLSRTGARFLSFGGYADAERQRIYLLPEYMQIENAEKITEYGYSLQTLAVSICASKFDEITHRAVMGSVLGLGIERDAIGDIVMLDGREAVVFCDSSAARLIIDSLLRVGRVAVSVGELSIDAVSIPQKQMQPISDTVASARLDCVVAALCSLSRERAKETVESGLVELEYEREEKCDREINALCVLSVRGYGKFKINSINEKTRKGRLRLLAEKYL